MNLIKIIYSKLRNLILYGVIGCFTAGIDFLIFTLLSKVIGVFFIYANCVSVLVGIFLSFLLNRAYNFKVMDKLKRRLAIFVTVGLSGLMLSNLILWVGIDKVSMDESLTKLMSIVLVVFFQFCMNKYVTFRESE